MMNNYQKRYKFLDNDELLKITDNPGCYQEDAVEAAKEELICRNLSLSDMAAARFTNTTPIVPPNLKEGIQ